MAISRRWFLLTGLVFGFIFTLYQLRGQTSLSRDSFSQLRPQDELLSEDIEGQFKWTSVPIRYPITHFTPLPHGKPRRLPRIQHKFEPESVTERGIRLERQQQVKEAFHRCWRSYRNRAWMQDELSPISGGSTNYFGGWGASLVDSLDTLHIMGLGNELEEAISAVQYLDFSTSTDSTINIFETTIRYLGGFLSAYDLTGDPLLIRKAVEVGEMLYVAFDTPNHMPVCRWDWQQAAQGQPQEAASGSLVSEIGSLSLEFTRLSQITGNPKWYDAIQRITDLFDQQQNLTKLPGMWPVLVNPREQIFTEDSGFTLGGMSDSLYEYFPKEYTLLGGLVPQYQKLYEDSMSTAIQYHFFRPMTPQNDDILISGNVRAEGGGPTEVALEPQGQHLGCFTGGMLALGGRLFDLPEHVEIGRKLVDGCIWAYDASPQGIMPETFHLVPCLSKEKCTWDEKRWKDEVVKRIASTEQDANDIIADKRLPPGFTDIGDRRYILRPEAIESIFVLYRITGDKTLQDVGWSMFNNVQNLTETEYANAALEDVTLNPPPKDDRMESFWLAETLKYFYLLFSEPNLISLDEYVFNTEAHPFKRPG